VLEGLHACALRHHVRCRFRGIADAIEQLLLFPDQAILPAWNPEVRLRLARWIALLGRCRKADPRAIVLEDVEGVGVDALEHDAALEGEFARRDGIGQASWGAEQLLDLLISPIDLSEGTSHWRWLWRGRW